MFFTPCFVLNFAFLTSGLFDLSIFLTFCCFPLLSCLEPGKITQLLVDRNTTSISLTWTPPPGEVFMHRVEWQVDRSAITTNDTFAVLSELIPGTSYTITITAVAGDQYGEPYTISSVTSKLHFLHLTPY